jgi:hypothetical protein
MTFWPWLKRQSDRDDPIGDLSKDALADKHRKGSTLAWWLKHLEQWGACDGVLIALEEAWQEYSKRKLRAKSRATAKTAGGDSCGRGHAGFMCIFCSRRFAI